MLYIKCSKLYNLCQQKRGLTPLLLVNFLFFFISCFLWSFHAADFGCGGITIRNRAPKITLGKDLLFFKKITLTPFSMEFSRSRLRFGRRSTPSQLLPSWHTQNIHKILHQHLFYNGPPCYNPKPYSRNKLYYHHMNCFA